DRRRTVASHHLLEQKFGQGFQVSGIGGVVTQQQIERLLFAASPSMPQPDCIPAIQAFDSLLPVDLQLALDAFKSALQSQASGGKAQIEVWLVEIQAGEGAVEVGNVEDAAEKRDEHIRLLERLVQ